MAYRPEWWPRTDGGATGVLEIALAVHMHNTGATDPMSDDDYRTALRCLVWVRDNWVPSMGTSAAFDNAVLRVVVAALQEADVKRLPF